MRSLIIFFFIMLAWVLYCLRLFDWIPRMM